MGYGVDLEDTFSSQMQRFLGENGVNAEIVNLGVPTFGNAEELVLLREEGLKYQPDLVLLAWHASDYAENVSSNLYGLEDGRLVRKNKTYLPKARIREFLFQFKAYRWVAGYSQFYKFVRNSVYFYIRKPLAGGVKRLSSAFRAKPGNDISKAKAHEANNNPGVSYREELAIALLKEMKSECVSSGASLLIFDIPVKLSRTEFESRFPESEGSITNDLEVFEPTELFRQHKGKKIYWEESEGHFTPLGCRIVGEGLARLALSKNLLNIKPVKPGNGLVR
jgi:hypothetical protein